jgi:diguanylate cyclase (GGDEF)-like protein
MAQLVREIDAQAHQLRLLAQVDELTGLPNRRAWSGELPHALERARRDARPLAVAMIDLDRFKSFNDEYGHPAGDRLLKSAAAAWTAELRGVDVLARYGGEEFIALLPDATADQAVEILARLRAATPLGQSFSAGVSVWDGRESSDELIARADETLYQAKGAGRRRTAVHPHLPTATADRPGGPGGPRRHVTLSSSAALAGGRQDQAEAEAAVGRRARLQGAAQQARPLPQPGQAVVGAGQRQHRPGRGRVGDRGAQHAAVPGDLDDGGGARGVLADVGQTLLHRAVHGPLHRRRQLRRGRQPPGGGPAAPGEAGGCMDEPECEFGEDDVEEDVEEGGGENFGEEDFDEDGGEDE